MNLHFKVGSSFGEVPVPVQGFLHGWKEGSDRVSSPGWEPVESLQDGNEKGTGFPPRVGGGDGTGFPNLEGSR